MPTKYTPTLHLTCGLPGAGKTTLARSIEADCGALRLTADEWLVGMFGDGITFEENELFRSRIETLLLDLAIRVLKLGVDVVLDFGVWTRAEREEFRRRAAEAGARSELHFLHAPIEQLLIRLERRNAESPPPAFRITEDQIRLWQTWFETPGADELAPREPA
ncbi:MAG: AAA family ATPase [Chloroflexi bacterium]|nr:AAA family ATPase [Chloroflexota bacterium]